MAVDGVIADDNNDIIATLNTNTILYGLFPTTHFVFVALTENHLKLIYQQLRRR
jgi:hypothetical protein